MEREEAIQWLKAMKSAYALPIETYEAIDIAIEALQDRPNKAVPPSLADVYKWERDIALSQLEEYGIGFAEKKRDDLVEVVRCKDCKNYSVEGETTQFGWCNALEMPIDEQSFCSYGERREP